MEQPYSRIANCWALFYCSLPIMTISLYSSTVMITKICFQSQVKTVMLLKKKKIHMDFMLRLKKKKKGKSTTITTKPTSITKPKHSWLWLSAETSITQPNFLQCSAPDLWLEYGYYPDNLFSCLGGSQIMRYPTTGGEGLIPTPPSM